MLETHDDIQAAASVTRNPAVPRLMANGFYTVSPDLEHPNPLHHFKRNRLVRHLTEVYGSHVDADPGELPFAIGRYQGGLYGYTDPGLRMAGIPEVTDNPDNGVIMVAVDRRRPV
jgi:hypothetical protein